MGASTSHTTDSKEHTAAASQLNDLRRSYDARGKTAGDKFVRHKLQECNCESVLQVFVGKFR